MTANCPYVKIRQTTVYAFCCESCKRIAHLLDKRSKELLENKLVRNTCSPRTTYTAQQVVQWNQQASATMEDKWMCKSIHKIKEKRFNQTISFHFHVETQTWNLNYSIIGVFPLQNGIMFTWLWDNLRCGICKIFGPAAKSNRLDALANQFVHKIFYLQFQSSLFFLHKKIKRSMLFFPEILFLN